MFHLSLIFARNGRQANGLLAGKCVFRGAGARPGAEPLYRTYVDSDKLITPPYGL